MRAETQTMSVATLAAPDEGQLSVRESVLLLGAFMALLISLGSFATL